MLILGFKELRRQKEALLAGKLHPLLSGGRSFD